MAVPTHVIVMNSVKSISGIPAKIARIGTKIRTMIGIFMVLMACFSVDIAFVPSDISFYQSGIRSTIPPPAHLSLQPIGTSRKDGARICYHATTFL